MSSTPSSRRGLGALGLNLAFGIWLGDYRWGLGHYVVVGLCGVLWAVSGGYAALMLVAGLPRLEGLPSGYLVSTIYIRNIEATGLFLVLGWAPIALALNAGRSAERSWSPAVMGALAGAAAIVFRLLFLAEDNPMANRDMIAWLLPFPLALFTVIPAANIAQRVYLRRRREWEGRAEAGAIPSKEKPPTETH
jgi:hypothetical protein